MILLPMPPGNNRYYRHYRGVTVLSAEGEAFKRDAGWICKAGGMKVLHGPVELMVILHPRQNKDGSSSRARLDLVGCLKAVCDALNGIGYADDRWIERLVAKVGEPMVMGGVPVQVRSVDMGVKN